MSNFKYVIAGAIFLAGCSAQNDEQHQKSTDSQEATRQAVAADIKPTMKDQAQEKTVPTIANRNLESQNASLLQINNGKYQLYSSKLTPGSWVMDLQLGEKARVTNKIVVVVQTSAGSQAAVSPETIKSRVDGNVAIKKLAGTVYEVSFMDSTTDMYKQYQTLLSLTGINKVELQLKYGSRDQQAEF